MTTLLINKHGRTAYDFTLKPRDCFELTAFTDATTEEGGVGGFVDIENASFSKSTGPNVATHQMKTFNGKSWRSGTIIVL